MRLLLAHRNSSGLEVEHLIRDQGDAGWSLAEAPTLRLARAPGLVYRHVTGQLVVLPPPWTLVEARMYAEAWELDCVEVYEAADDLPIPGGFARPDLSASTPAWHPYD